MFPRFFKCNLLILKVLVIALSLTFLSFADCTEEFALRHIGIREDGQNKGTEVEKLQKRFGYPSGTPYCGLYAYAAHIDCGVPASQLPKQFALARAWCVQEKIVWKRGQDPAPIQKGMTVLLWINSVDTVGHVGVVFNKSKDRSGDYIVYHSGNTRSNNIISGDGVHLVKIYLRSIYAIADYITPIGEEPVKYHVVTTGENLYRLSLKYNKTVQELMQMNGLKSSTVYLGQQLRVG